MALNVELFKKVVAPEYTNMTTAQLSLFSSEAELEVAPSKWGKFTDRAVALMTAHLITMSDLSKNGDAQSPNKQIKKTKVGDIEKEFADSKISPEDGDSLSLTIYGMEFKRLRKKILKGPIFVSC